MRLIEKNSTIVATPLKRRLMGFKTYAPAAIPITGTLLVPKLGLEDRHAFIFQFQLLHEREKFLHHEDSPRFPPSRGEGDTLAVGMNMEIVQNNRSVTHLIHCQPEPLEFPAFQGDLPQLDCALSSFVLSHERLASFGLSRAEQVPSIRCPCKR